MPGFPCCCKIRVFGHFSGEFTLHHKETKPGGSATDWTNLRDVYDETGKNRSSSGITRPWDIDYTTSTLYFAGDDTASGDNRRVYSADLSADPYVATEEFDLGAGTTIRTLYFEPSTSLWYYEVNDDLFKHDGVSETSLFTPSPAIGNGVFYVDETNNYIYVVSTAGNTVDRYDLDGANKTNLVTPGSGFSVSRLTIAADQSNGWVFYAQAKPGTSELRKVTTAGASDTLIRTLSDPILDSHTFYNNHQDDLYLTDQTGFIRVNVASGGSTVINTSSIEPLQGMLLGERHVSPDDED